MAILILPGTAICAVLLSIYLTTTSFIYLLQHYKGKVNKENIFVFFCSLLTFALSTFYFVFELLRGGKEYTIKSKFLCVLIPLVYQTSIMVSKVFSNLIFVYRYETINRLLTAPKRSKILAVVIIYLSLLQFVGRVIFLTVIQSTSSLDECSYDKLFIPENVSYSYFASGCFILMIVLQIIIVVEIIKPIYKNYLKSTTAYNLNGKLRNTLYRVVWCSIMLVTADIGLLVAYYTVVKKNLLQPPILFIGYLFVNLLSFVCSYKNCGKRLFPFKTVFKSNLTENSSQLRISETPEKSAKIQLNCTLDPTLQLLVGNQLNSFRSNDYATLKQKTTI